MATNVKITLFGGFSIYKDGKLIKKSIFGNIVNVRDEKIDKQMIAHFQPTIDKVKEYVSQKIGYFKNPIYTREKGVYLELGDAKETLARLIAGIA